ncbi:uncharacterized protein C5L36_0A06370 [Pichia kudriavzevii]|uniref:rRNA methyltransferase 2, mitochondrial n=1 Tax=Pichia kudriavzevii TaxID=4909 RepID=A0A2U9QYD8_PICKU|nr:uncharacterized protein C5L36_0A06370 [Pichia kudriavzevii]AWU74043.1 hypothetical protein C5L36_0A06370 [Pichia kudriavzevii]
MRYIITHLFCVPQTPITRYSRYSLKATRLFSSTRTLTKSSSSSNRWTNRQANDFYTRKAKHENLKSRAAFKLLQIDEKFGIFSKCKSKRKMPLNVLDLGAAPGAWNQVALERCPAKSKILGVDLLPYQPPSGASALQGNILSKATHERIKDFFTLSALEKNDQLFNDVEILSKNGNKLEDIEYSSIVAKEVEMGQLMDDAKLKRDANDIKFQYPVDVILSDMMANTSGLAFRDHMMSMDLCDAALVTAVDLLKKDGSLVIKFFTGKEDNLLEKRLHRVFKNVERFKPRACRMESKECYFVCLGKRDYFVDKVHLFAIT